MLRNNKKRLLVVLTLTSTLAITSCNYDDLKTFGKRLVKLYNDQFEIEKLRTTNQSGTKFIVADTSAPIGVVIKTNAKEKDKKVIIAAIDEINKISPNIDYVYQESETTLENYIEIYTDFDIEKEEYVGLFKSDINHQAGIFKYPLKIYLEKDIKDHIGPNGKSYYSHVVKHELMHSLGFKDLTSDIYSGYSVMSYQGTTYGFTDNDIKNIQTVYGKEEKPKDTQTVDSKQISMPFDYTYHKKSDDEYSM